MPPTLSWRSAGWTFTLSRVPSVSTSACRLRPLIFLPPSYARPAGRCCLDRLAVNDGGRGKRTSAALGPIALAQDLVDAFPLPGPAPCAEVVIHHAPWRQVMRHHAPRDAAPEHIEAAVKDTAKLIAPVRTSVLTRHKHARDKLPLCVRQISRIGLRSHGSSPVCRPRPSTEYNRRPER